jgi:hypothetical protein
MIKDLIKFVAKIAIVAVVFVYFIAPHIPGMPKVGELFHLPSWQQVAKFALDPGDLSGKIDNFNKWVNNTPPVHIGKVTLPKPHAPSSDQSFEDNAKHVLTGGIL